jgi:hypothetical protein
MANSIINADSEGLKQTGGDSNILNIQTGGNNAISISATGTVTLPAAALPVGSGGTGVTSVGTSGNVLTSNGTAWVSQAAAAGGGDYIMQVFTTPGTWTKAAGLKAIRVTVIGGGGGFAFPTSPANAGGTSSFGSPAFLSATGGAAGGQGAGGAGSGGQLNASGMRGFSPNQPLAGCIPFTGAIGGSSAFGFAQGNPFAGVQVAGLAYGGGAAGTSTGCGGGGGAIEYIDAPALPGPQPYTVGAGGPGTPGGAAGAAGVIIVEEFY